MEYHSYRQNEAPGQIRRELHLSLVLSLPLRSLDLIAKTSNRERSYSKSNKSEGGGVTQNPTRVKEERERANGGSNAADEGNARN